MLNHTMTEIIIAGTLSGLFLPTVAITAYLIYSHMSYYTVPQAQTYIVRIVMMAPIYSFTALLSVVFHEYSLYFDLVRDCYEAFVLYQFFSLILYFFNMEAGEYFPADIRLNELNSLSDHNEIVIDGDEEEDEEEEDDMTKSEPRVEIETSHYLSKMGLTKFPFPCCCLPSVVPDGVLFVRIRLMVFQYVITRPLLSLIAVILHTQGDYHAGSFDIRYGYLWIALLMNLSVFVALYGLLIFYQLTHHVIKSHRPLMKLLSIKAVLFFVFWQSVLITALAYKGWVPVLDVKGGPDASAAIINNVLVSIEMVILAIVNMFAFANTEYKIMFAYTIPDPGAETKNYTSKRAKNIVTQVFNPMDIMKDGNNILTGKETKVQ